MSSRIANPDSKIYQKNQSPRRAGRGSPRPHSPDQPRPREVDPEHISFIKRLPCLISGTPGVDPAHLRQESWALHRKALTGGGRKPDDCWVNPLSHRLHELQGDINEYRFWMAAGIDPFKSAQLLYAFSRDLGMGRKIVRQIYQRQICQWTDETEKAFGR